MNLYQFIGTLTVYQCDSSNAISSVKASLGLDNLLLRGAKLKDTEFIYGTTTISLTEYDCFVHCIHYFLNQFRVCRVYWPTN